MAHPNFISKYPKSAGKTPTGLALTPVAIRTTENNGYDQDDVKAALGVTRFNSLMTLIAAGKPYSGAVFCCGHRVNKSGVEVPCIYAADLELFLVNGG
jgi:hypothetical protein